MLTPRKGGCVNLDTKKERLLTKKKRNMRLQSNIRLIRKWWTLRFCPKLSSTPWGLSQRTTDDI
uniref:Uncharacterized protein n=1 Tax=Monodelphis domestica TaxID=13616 RepID=A0A5F8HBZ8_MONDO